MTTPHAVTARESVPLLTTWVSRLAEDAGIRAFVVKGPLAAEQGLRPPRESGDVDIWVDPAQVEHYQALLEARGWYAVVNDRPSILPRHARAMRHERWGCELDVHDRFPGFFADRVVVFERLWQLRDPQSQAHGRVVALSRPGSAVVLALHLLRDLVPGRPEDDFAFLVEAVRGFSGDERRSIVELAAIGGANEPLRPFLDAADLTPLPGVPVSDQDLDDWRLMTRTHRAPTVYWIHHLGRTPVWRWPTFAWRAFWMTDDQIRVSEPSAGTTRWSMLRARLRRLRRGVMMLPRAVRLVRSSKHHR